MELHTTNVINSEQIILLINAASHLHKFVTLGEGDEPMVDKDTKDAVAATLINISTRLDKILGDDSRWTTKNNEDAIAAAGRMYEEQANLMKVSRNLAEQAELPHRTRNVDIYALTGGKFLACEGDPTVSHTIKTIAASPEEALLHFDLTWKGIMEYKPFALPMAKGVANPRRKTNPKPKPE
jgi:hypothetical protein